MHSYYYKDSLMKKYLIILALLCNSITWLPIKAADNNPEQSIITVEIKQREQVNNQKPDVDIQDKQFQDDWNKLNTNINTLVTQSDNQSNQIHQVLEMLQTLNELKKIIDTQSTMLATSATPDQVKNIIADNNQAINDALKLLGESICEIQAKNFKTLDSSIKQQIDTNKTAINESLGTQNFRLTQLELKIHQMQVFLNMELIQKKAQEHIKKCIKNKDLSTIKEYLNPALFNNAQCSPEHRVNALLNHANANKHTKSFGKYNASKLILLVLAELLSVILHKELLNSIPQIAAAQNAQLFTLRATQGIVALIIGAYIQHGIKIYTHNKFVTALQSKLTALNNTINAHKDNLSSTQQFNAYITTYKAEFNS